MLQMARKRQIAKKRRDTLVATVTWAASRLGYDVLERDYCGYYSPVVDPAALPPDLWSQPRPTPGLKIDVAAHLDFLEHDLLPYLHEFQPPVAQAQPGFGFYLANGYYGAVDAHILYAMIRHAKPRRLVELGSGFSTLVTLAAARLNDREGDPVDHRVFDPYAEDHMQMTAAELERIQRIPATQVPLDEFLALEAGDILFVDTTHTVKPAGEVNYVVLEVLPVLRPGVIVHVHDIFLPWEYPRRWIEDLRRQWTEQYLLQAMLSCNPCFDVLFAAHAVARADPERLRESIPSFDPGVLEHTASPVYSFIPGAFWFRRTDTD